MKILVTGFEPFGEEKINPSMEVVKLLPNEINDVEIIKAILPTVRYESLNIIRDLLIKENPSVILSLGLAGGREKICVERIGINVDDYRIADNKGNQPVDESIFEDGPDAYFSTLPIREIVDEINKNKIPAMISNNAGTYVCNHVLYGTRHMIEKEFNGKQCGFVHVPFIKEQVNDKPSMPAMGLDTIVEAIVITLKVIINFKGA